MQNKYSLIAIRAFEFIEMGLSAEQAWEKASCEIYEKGSPSQKKGCPRNAFLGLTSKKPQSKNGKNVLYARRAHEILQNNLNKSFTPNELWAMVIDKPKTHNSQMNVVLALWDKKLIR